MRVTLLALLASLTTTTAMALTVECDGGTWVGTSTYFESENTQPNPDRVTLPQYRYEIETGSSEAIRYTGKSAFKMQMLHSYRSYVVLSAVEGGVLYTDTVFDNGFVISQYTKYMMGFPVASTFQKQCSVS